MNLLLGGGGGGVKISNLSGGKHYPQFEQMGRGVNWQSLCSWLLERAYKIVFSLDIVSLKPF